MIRFIRVSVAVAALFLCLGQPVFAEKASFTVSFKDDETPYRVTAVYVLPGEWIPLSVPAGRYAISASTGNVVSITKNSWEWEAPRKAGVYPVTITSLRHFDAVVLNMVVLKTVDQLKPETRFHMGSYPSNPPRGFVEVTAENVDTRVSPHFKLKQFLSKQTPSFPQYIAITERLVLKLECVLEKVNETGVSCNTLTVMSGFRSPAYNRAIGNHTRLSRHQWGDAADVLVMDLNKDGVINGKDATAFYKIAEQTQFLGGLASYRSNSAHGPFVHIDTRGFRARW